jgi:hypothetical protein
LGDQRGSRAAWPVISDPLVFDIHPKTKDIGHKEFHYVFSNRSSFCLN